jgi:methylmalonyl-CoA/ethylmalonyl-CoA epimerase
MSLVEGLSHVSLAVPDLEQAAKRLQDVYGLTIGEVLVNETQGVRLAYVELGNARIELMQPLRADSPVGKFLERNPRGGIHHFCLEVGSVDKATETISSRGAKVLGDVKAQRNVHGERIAFIHPQDFLGALVELEEHGKGGC